MLKSELLKKYLLINQNSIELLTDDIDDLKEHRDEMIKEGSISSDFVIAEFIDEFKEDKYQDTFFVEVEDGFCYLDTILKYSEIVDVDYHSNWYGVLS